MKARQIIDGKWYTPNPYVGCCDCGLIHRIEHRVRNGVVQFRVWRKSRLSAQRRKTKKFPFTKA